MRLTIIDKRVEVWETQALAEAAVKRGWSAEIVDITSLNDVGETVSGLGDIVIWRYASTLGSALWAKATILRLLKNKFVLNRDILSRTYLPMKMAQQILMAMETDVATIPTFQFKDEVQLREAIGAGKLSWPMVLKRNVGTRGEGVRKLDSYHEVRMTPKDFKATIFQPFLANRGDYRVLMLDGVVLGAIHRRARAGEFRNNISQGAIAEKVTDEATMKRLNEIAAKVYQVAQLPLLGIDILHSVDDDRWYFLELNTIPEWRGFQQATGIDVAERVLSLCHEWYEKSLNNQHYRVGVI